MQKRKQIEIHAVTRGERRTAHRRQQTQAHRLSISVRTVDGAEHAGHFQDLSIGGASARFSFDDLAIQPGQIVVLTIGSLTRTSKVIAKARVMFSSEVKGGRSCGFHFIEPALLLPQIDSFYGRFFNRRKSQRVGMPLDKKIQVKLFQAGSEVTTELVDLSTDGMQVRTNRAGAKCFESTNHLSFRLELPGQRQELHGRAAILRRSQTRDGVLFGLAFDLLEPDGIAKQTANLQSWIVHRSNEISKWDSSLNKPDAA